MIRFEQTPVFKSDAKKLGKRYPSFKDDFKDLVKSLAKNPEQGTKLVGGFRKIRMAITSKGKGKSGGARVITINCLVNAGDGVVTFVDVYDKSEKESITAKEIKAAWDSLKKMTKFPMSGISHFLPLKFFKKTEFSA